MTDDLPLAAGITLWVLSGIIAIVALGWVPYRRRPAAALGWLVAILFIPYVGLIAFLLIGNFKLPKRRMQMQREVNEVIKRNLGEDRYLIAGAETPVLKRAQRAARLNHHLGALPLSDGNEFSGVHTDNHEIMRLMAADIDAATAFVHVENYIVSDTEPASDVLISSLIRAHHRGITVRLLLDHMGSGQYPGFRKLAKRLDAEGVPWRRMLPINPIRGRYRRPDLRNHRKVVVIDGEKAWIPSQNFIDRGYLKAGNRRRGLQWTDIAVEARGPVVRALDAVFATDWYCETGEMLLDEVPQTLPMPRNGGALAQVVPSGPGFETENNLKLFDLLIYNAHRRVSLCTPYFVPDESLILALVTMARAGIEVELFASEVSDHRVSQYAQASYYEELVVAGVDVWLYPAPTVLHSKFLRVDDELCVIGSSNFDVRSFALDLEVSTMIVDREFSGELGRVEDGYREVSHQIDLAAWRRRPWHVKYRENLARLTSSLL